MEFFKIFEMIEQPVGLRRQKLIYSLKCLKYRLYKFHNNVNN